MRIGIDAGGTFTDVVTLHDDGTLTLFKRRSDPSDPAKVILDAIAEAIASRGVCEEVVHGSTVATNALLERKGARTTLITSVGFRDLLALGRQNRSALYSLHPPERVNLIPPERCLEWTGDADELRRLLVRTAPESIAICLLGAHADASEEKLVEAALAGADRYCCRSSEIAPEFREYERASTTVLNAYVGPLMTGYLSRLETECPFPLRILQSNGGSLSAEEARRHAVRTILSGPAGGVVGAQAMARRAGWRQAIAFDMGGTSTDVSLVEDPLRFATEAWVEGLPVRVPMLEIHTVGAGGGSLAAVDAGGRLRVGPESAGARPGPACYGIGSQATVTDAHVVLGRILPDRFLDGSMTIDPDRARRATQAIGDAMGLSLEGAASAIVRIANSNMERAIRVVSVENGRNPAEFPLVAFGGCGGLHACEIAEELGLSSVIFPPYAGALSAVGMLLAAPTRDYAAGALTHQDANIVFDQLAERVRAENPHATLSCSADIRYRGQSYELTVDWERDEPRRPFEAAYRRVYGFVNQTRAIEVVTARVRAVDPVDTAWFERVSGNAGDPASTTTRPVFYVDQVYDAVSLGRALVQDCMAGPLLIHDYGSTVFVPPGWNVERGSAGVLVATRA